MFFLVDLLQVDPELLHGEKTECEVKNPHGGYPAHSHSIPCQNTSWAGNPKSWERAEEERTQKNWPVGGLVLATGPTSGDNTCSESTRDRNPGEEVCSGSFQVEKLGKAAECKAPLTLLFHRAAPHPRTHLFQGVRCSFNDLREMFIIFSDDVLQHVCRQGDVGEAPGLSRGQGAAAPWSALLREAQSGPRTVLMESSAKA